MRMDIKKQKTKKLVFAFAFSLFLVALFYFLSFTYVENKPTTPLTVELHQVINYQKMSQCDEPSGDAGDCKEDTATIVENNNKLMKQILEKYIPIGLSKAEAEKILIDSGFNIHSYYYDGTFVNQFVADRVTRRPRIHVFCCTFQLRVSIKIKNDYVDEVNIKYYGIGA